MKRLNIAMSIMTMSLLLTSCGIRPSRPSYNGGNSVDPYTAVDILSNAYKTAQKSQYEKGQCVETYITLDYKDPVRYEYVYDVKKSYMYDGGMGLGLTKKDGKFIGFRPDNKTYLYSNYDNRSIKESLNYHYNNMIGMIYKPALGLLTSFESYQKQFTNDLLFVGKITSYSNFDIEVEKLEGKKNNLICNIIGTYQDAVIEDITYPSITLNMEFGITDNIFSHYKYELINDSYHRSINGDFSLDITLKYYDVSDYTLGYY